MKTGRQVYWEISRGLGDVRWTESSIEDESKARQICHTIYDYTRNIKLPSLSVIIDTVIA